MRGNMRLAIPAGQLETTKHPLAASPASLSEAINCSRDRGVFELDTRYRQVDPTKVPSPVIASPQGTTGFGFGSFNGYSRFFLTDGDAAFYSSPTDDTDFLLRTSDGSTALMSDARVHSGTDLWTGRSYAWQYQKDLFIANPSFVRRLNVQNPGSDNSLVAKSYDPSLYTAYESLLDNCVVQGYVGATFTRLSGSGTLALNQAGTGLTLFDTHVNGADVGAGYTFKVAFAAPVAIPAGMKWLMLKFTRATDGASFQGYGGQVTPGTSDVYNTVYSLGQQANITLIDGVNTYSSQAYFITVGNTQYLFAPMVYGVSTAFDHLQFTFWCLEDANEKFQISSLYMVGAPLLDDLSTGSQNTGYLAGFGPVYQSTDLINYAFRGSDAMRTTFTVPTLIQIPKASLYNQAFFTTPALPVPVGPPAMPRKAVLNVGAAAIPGGSANAQFLRQASDGKWYEIGFVSNTSGATVTDTNTDVQTRALPRNYTLTVPGPSLTGITAGCEWKAHNCYGRSDGYVILASQTNYAQFVLPEYTTGFTGLVTDTTQPVYKPISGQKEPVLSMHGLDALFVLCRRSVYAITGQNGLTAAGPFRIPGFPGLISSLGSCPYLDGILAASDDGLYYIVHPEYYVSKSIAQNMTRHILAGSWNDLIGDQTQRSRVVLAQGEGHIWVFRDNLYMHLSPLGIWSTGSWASKKNVVAAASDYSGRIAIAFSDTSVGYLGAFPTDGGVTLAGTDGVEPLWKATKRFRGPFSPVRVDCEVETDSPGASGVSVLLSTDRSVEDPIEVTFPDVPFNRPVPRAEYLVAERWLEASVQGSGGERALETMIEAVPTEDGRART